MFAGVVVFSVIGFKATATHDRCLEERESLIKRNVTDLPICDLQQELANVYNENILSFYILIKYYFMICRAHLVQD